MTLHLQLSLHKKLAGEDEVGVKGKAKAKAKAPPRDPKKEAGVEAEAGAKAKDEVEDETTTKFLGHLPLRENGNPNSLQSFLTKAKTCGMLSNNMTK